jgi:hypothetical protein
MHRLWLPLLTALLLVAGPTGAAPRSVPLGDTVRDRLSDDEYWRRIVREQEAGRSCESREPGRLVIRHPPIPDGYARGMARDRVACSVIVIIAALRERQPVELENVVVTGTLDFREATTVIAQPELPVRRPFHRELLQKWLDERRREHRAPDVLPAQTRFRPVTVPVAIRGSLLDAVEAAAEDPLFFLEAVDLRGTRIEGPVNFAGAVFSERVTFEAGELPRRVSFAGAHFDAGVDLSRARLGPETRFDAASFGTRALTRRAGGVERRLAEEPALFVGAAFGDGATFRDAVFESRADFQKATFVGAADLAAARFHRRADFGHAVFQGVTDAANIVFEDHVRFPNAVFEKAATFRRAQFQRYADFGLATFADAASTFRDAEFGAPPALPHRLGDVGAWLHRLSDRVGYDFRETRFADKGRTMARTRFHVHSTFALVTLASAAVGLVACFALRRRPLVCWRPAAPNAEAVATVDEVNAAVPGWRKASPHQRLSDGAFLIAAYAVLVAGLGAHYQTHAGLAVDAAIVWIYPAAGIVVWALAVGGAVLAWGLKFRHLPSLVRPATQAWPMLDYFDLTYHVPRKCDAFVEQFLSRVSTGVLGLAGARGAGRSSLARAVLDRLTDPARHHAAPEILGVTVSSPPTADLFPFFTVLFRRVAEEARRDVRRRLFGLSRGSALADTAGELIASLPPITFLPVGVVVASVAFFLAYGWRLPAPTGAPADWTPVLLLGTVVVCTILYYGWVLRRSALRRAVHDRPSGRLYIHTERVLERLAYEESTSDEREGALALPRGLTLRRRRTRALKERPVTLAAVLDDFGRYVDELRRVYPRGVVVHIDDADRIEDLKDVRDLVLRLKGTLVGGVLFLVPLPDAVLDGYRLRTEGPGSAVAGMLDDLTVVPPMTTDEAIRMLAKRGFFADPADPSALRPRDGLGLAICLVSGGIPKEALRLLRRVTAETDACSTARLVQSAWCEARDAARDAVLRSSIPASQKRQVLEAIERLSRRHDEAAWAELVDSLAREPGASGEAATSRKELVDLLGRLGQRRQAARTLEARLGELEACEAALVEDKRITGDERLDVPEWLDGIRRSFLLEAGAASSGRLT